MKIQSETNKLFYNEYPFKIACKIRGAHAINNSLRYKINYVNQYDYNLRDHKEMNTFLSKIKPFYDQNIKIRSEMLHFNIFCKEKQLAEDIAKSLQKWVVDFYGPKNDLELQYILDNGPKKILCDTFPKNKFRYRVFFNPNTKVDVRHSFLSWSEKNSKILLSPTTIRWCKNNAKYLQLPFGYVEDQGTMTLVTLMIGNDIKKIEEFIPRNCINTEHKEI